jgi:methionyl-tRNA synthetase
VPGGGGDGEAEQALATDLTARVQTYGAHLADRQFRKAAAELRAIWATGNAYWEKSEPWKAAKVDADRTAMILRTGVNLVRLFSLLAVPIIPETATRALHAVAPDDAVGWPADVRGALAAIPPGAAFAVPEVLFRKISDDDVAEWTARFGGAAGAEDA